MVHHLGCVEVLLVFRESRLLSFHLSGRPNGLVTWLRHASSVWRQVAATCWRRLLLEVVVVVHYAAGRTRGGARWWQRVLHYALLGSRCHNRTWSVELLLQQSCRRRVAIRVVAILIRQRLEGLRRVAGVMVTLGWGYLLLLLLLLLYVMRMTLLRRRWRLVMHLLVSHWLLLHHRLLRLVLLWALLLLRRKSLRSRWQLLLLSVEWKLLRW